MRKGLRRAFMTAALMLGSMDAISAQTPAQKDSAAKIGKIDRNFSVWLKAARKEALAKGFSQKTVDAALPIGMKPLHRAISLDRAQPENKQKFETYVRAVLSARRTSGGIKAYAAKDSLLQKIGKAYHVDPAAVVALWGIETNYGMNTGTFNVCQALATMSFEGRRATFFKNELFAALKIIEDGDKTAAGLKGSWAGAMGQTQFMPSSFHRYAQDFDGDGRRDIWDTRADVLASAANYLHQAGWKEGQRWGDSAVAPAGINRGLIGMDTRRPAKFWRDAGIRLANGNSWPSDDTMASLIQPDGPGTGAYLVYDNFRVFLNWNRSLSFATSAGKLSDIIRKGP